MVRPQKLPAAGAQVLIGMVRDRADKSLAFLFLLAALIGAVLLQIQVYLANNCLYDLKDFYALER